MEALLPIAIQAAPILWAVLLPVITEMVKALVKQWKGKTPPNMVPIMSTVLGGVLGALAEAFAPGMGMGPESGAVAGAAGTGVHQVLTAHQYRKKSRSVDVPAWLPIVLLAALAAMALVPAPAFAWGEEPAPIYLDAYLDAQDYDVSIDPYDQAWGGPQVGWYFAVFEDPQAEHPNCKGPYSEREECEVYESGYADRGYETGPCEIYAIRSERQAGQ